ncbi:uncharacterized protein LOC110255703 isoform X3 [Sus scrofa]|uniref:uncharacterized protein LOC110255703 isoform X3 n=1 Tax=Sus scrofa TaxID=9823 RepID=UPI000A2B9960|nr:uncharacterized protein LOC110255703 isoform X3 [Sus scrofa]
MPLLGAAREGWAAPLPLGRNLHSKRELCHLPPGKEQDSGSLGNLTALSSTPRTASEFGGITDVSRRVQGPADVTCKRQEEKLSSASRTATRVPSPLEDLRSPGSPQLLRPRGSTVDLPEQPHPSGPGSALKAQEMPVMFVCGRWKKQEGKAGPQSPGGGGGGSDLPQGGLEPRRGPDGRGKSLAGTQWTWSSWVPERCHPGLVPDGREALPQASAKC